jgi:hypothetical protein
MSTTTSRRGGSSATTLAGDPFEQKTEKNISQDQTLARRKNPEKGLSKKARVLRWEQINTATWILFDPAGPQIIVPRPTDNGRDLKRLPHWLGCATSAPVEQIGEFGFVSTRAAGEPLAVSAISISLSASHRRRSRHDLRPTQHPTRAQDRSGRAA